MSSSTDPARRPQKERKRNLSVDLGQPGDGASEDPNQDTNIQAWLANIARSTEPPSSTAICHVSYRFERLPKIHAIPIRVTSKRESQPGGPDSEFHSIYSKRLRKLAIESFVEQELPGLGKKFAIKLAEEGFSNATASGLVDIILVLNVEMQQAPATALRGLRSQGKIVVSAVSKRIRNKATAESVHCELEPVEVHSVSSDAGADKYWKMLKLLLREVTIRSVPPNGFLSGCKEILFDTLAKDPESPARSDFGTETSDSSHWSAFSSLKSEDELRIQEADIFKVRFRSKVKIAPTDNGVLHVEFDLVPGLENGLRLSELVLRVLGPSVLNGSEHTSLSIIRSMLVGLHVTRDHNEPDSAATTPALTATTPALTATTPALAATTNGSMATGQDHSTGILSKTSPRSSTFNLSQSADSSELSMDKRNSASNHAFMIRNIKLPGQVPDFQVDDERISVHKYFTTKILKSKRGLEYPSLPLAEIARDTWVPLETLVTSGIQMITNRGLTRTLMKRTRKAYELDDQHRHFAVELANDIVEPLNGYLDFNESDKIPIETFGRLTPKKSMKINKPKASSPKQRLHSDSSQPIILKFGIIYVKAKGVQRQHAIDPNTLVEKIKAQCKQSDHSLSKLIEIDPGFEHHAASIADTKPLLLLPDFGGSAELQNMYQKRPNTILAIIDSTGWSESELRNIRAYLQKFGNRKIGAVTYCTTENTYSQSVEANVNAANYFPLKTLQFLTVMHGQPLFTTDILQGISGVDKPMIIGAHISHPDPGCAEHCPSVAALVASTDEKLTKYPGSVRLQPTYRSAEWHGKHLKRKMESQILDLEDMMTERLRAWQKIHTKAIPSVIFYRDSIGFREETVIENEKGMIFAALKAVFGETVSFTYVVANKCRVSPYDTRWKHPVAADGAEHFTTSGLEGSNKGHEYRYLVEPATNQFPRVDLGMDALARLTYNLNTSFQLDKRVAIALPLHYARKLACHTFNYFRFAVTNQYDIVPSVSRRLNGSDKEAETNGKEMVKMMREYLFSDSPRGHSDVSQSFGRVNPWLEELDEKMFYI